MLTRILWPLLAVVLLVLGWLTVGACGVGLPSGARLLDFCPRPTPADPAERELAQERIRTAMLEDRLARLRLVVATAPSCPVGSVPQLPASEPGAPPVGPALAALGVCPPPPTDSVLLIRDVSASMRWPVNLDAALEDELIRLAEANNHTRYDRLLERIEALPGLDRMIAARNALLSLVENADPGVSFSYLWFSACRSTAAPTDYGTDRAALMQRVRTEAIGSQTALGEALRVAAAWAARRPDPSQPLNVVLVADGNDNCNADPCAVARQIGQEHPAMRIGVIALTRSNRQRQRLQCIADATGGMLVAPENAGDLAELIQAAAGQGPRPAHCR